MHYPAEEIDICPDDILLGKEIVNLKRYTRLQLCWYGGDGFRSDHAREILDYKFEFGELGGYCDGDIASGTAHLLSPIRTRLDLDLEEILREHDRNSHLILCPLRNCPIVIGHAME